MRISENLWQVGGETLTAPGDAGIYLVRFGDEAALIDAGTGKGHGQLVNRIDSVIPPDVAIKYLFLTHCHYDHTGGCAAIREQYGCRIVIHEKEAPYLANGDSTVTAATWYGAVMTPVVVDDQIRGDTERFTIGNGEMTAIFCPGHSPGSVVYLATVDSKKVLFGQDVHGPLHPSLLSDRTSYIKSLRRMVSFDAEILCEGHFGIYHGKNDVRRFIGSYLEV